MNKLILGPDGKQYDHSCFRVISSMSIRDGCFYCEEIADTWDHIVPRIRGGIGTIDNLVPSCRSCNSRKGSKPLYIFRRHLRKKGLFADFETPDPQPIAGTYFSKSGGNEFYFRSNDKRITITNIKEFFDHVYVNEK